MPTYVIAVIVFTCVFFAFCYWIQLVPEKAVKLKKYIAVGLAVVSFGVFMITVFLGVTNPGFLTPIELRITAITSFVVLAGMILYMLKNEII